MRALLGLLALVLGGVVVVRLLGAERGTLLVLLVGALPLVLLAAYPLLLAAALIRSRRLVVAALALVVAHVALVAPSLRAAPVPTGASEAPRLRVVVANLYRNNPDPARAADFLRGLDADVLVVAELDARGRAAVEQAGLTADLPFTVPPSRDGETIGLLSRLPIRELAQRQIGARIQPEVTVDVDGVAVRVFAVHPLPPLAGLEPLWRATLSDAARRAERTALPLVVAGDLNADRDHGVFRQLTATGLRDVSDELGRGLAGTWPSRLPLLQLDHVLVRDGRTDTGGARLVPLSVREVRVPGSDHRAVVAELAVLAGPA